MDAGVERMLLYKRIQRVPLRSTLNIALYDMRKLEYDIRRTVVSADRLMSANVLKDNYVERLMETKKAEVFAEFVPRKHRRSSPQAGTQRTTTVTPVRRSQEGLSPGLRRSADIISLQLKCRKAKIGIRQEKRSVCGNFRRALHAFRSCSSGIERVRCGTPAPPSECPTEQLATTLGELRRKVMEIRRMRGTLTPG